MSLLSTVSQGTTQVNIAGTVASLAGVAKALVKPKNTVPGIAGFVFDIPETETIKLQALVTNHYTEANYSISDHVAFDPISITLVGLVGELVIEQDVLQQTVQAVLDRLTSTSLLSPGLSASAQAYLTEYSRVKNAFNSAIKQWNSFSDAVGLTGASGGKLGGDVRSRQQRFYDGITSLFNSRALVTVETPWRMFGEGTDSNGNESFPFIIESLEFHQEAETKDLSRVTVVLREFRTVSTTAGAGKLSGRAVVQQAPKTEGGKATVDHNSAAWNDLANRGRQ